MSTASNEPPEIGPEPPSESEARFRTLFDNAPGAILMLDAETGRFTEANQQACELLGLTQAEFTAMGAADVSMPAQADGSDSLARANELIQQALATGKPMVLEWTLRHADGSPIDVEVRLTRMPSERGQMVVGMLRDLRPERAATAAAAQREREFRTLAENSPDWIVRIDRDLRRTYVNRAVAEAAGVPAAELIGKRPTESFPGSEDMEAWEEALRRCFETGEPQVVERETNLGVIRVLQMSIVPERDERGEIVSALSVTRDVTSIRRAVEAETRLAGIVDSANDAIMSSALDGTITSWNAGAERMFGYRAADVLGKTSEFLFDGDTSAREAIRARLSAGETVPGYVREWRAADGRKVTTSSTFFPLRDSDGQVIGTASIARDLTDEVAASRALALSEERLRLAFEMARMGTWSYDLQADRIEFSAQAAAIYGRRPDEMPRTMREAIGLIHPEDSPTTVDRLRSGIPAGSMPREYRVRMPDGDYRWISGIGDLVQTENTVSGLIIDVHERKLAEDAIRESEEQLRQVVESVSAGIWVYDGSLVLLVNSALANLTGYTREQLLQPGFFETFISPEQTAVMRQRTRARLAGEPVTPNYEITMTRADGERRYWELVASRITFRGVPCSIVSAFDVTERRLSEEALRESEARFRAVVNSTAVGIIIFDGREVIEANPAAGRIFGVDPTTLTTPGFMASLTDDATRAEVLARGAARARGEDVPEAFEADIRHSSGKILRIQMNATTVELAGARVAMVTMIDITERLAAEEAVRRSEARFRSVVNSAAVGIVIFDGESVTEVNPAATHIFGFPAEELMAPGKLSGLIDDSTREAVREVVYARFRGVDSAPVTLEVQARNASGHGIHLHVTVSTIELGGRIAALVTLVDISERRRAEDALRASEARFRSLVDNSPDYITRIGRDLRHEFVNKTAEREAGLDPVEVIGKRGDELGYAPEIGALWLARHREVFETGEALEFEYTLENSPEPGQTAYRRARLIPETSEDGTVQHVLSIVTNVTAERTAALERRRMDQQMQQAQKLESLGVLAGGIAHDFNNLLVAILGNAGLALLELPPESPARQTVQSIETAAQRAAELTRQMLAYSGKGRFIIEPLNLSRLVDEMAHLLEVSVSKRAVLKFRFAPDLPAIEGDATQVRQVIMNLIINASDAIGDRSGVISINTGMLYADHAYLTSAYVDGDIPEGDYVFLEVADTGVGMDEETRARIFDPFFTTKFTGRGLGLAAVLGIVRGHRGAIKLYSEPGRGTTFKVLFPAGTLPHRPTETIEAGVPEQSSKGRTILVVDDDETVRTVTRRILEHAGITVLQAADGAEGVEVYAANPGISLVLLDMTMPRMDGEQTFRELRRVHPEVRVILTSGYNEQDATEQFAGKGLAGFIQKPYRPAELLAKIEAALT